MVNFNYIVLESKMLRLRFLTHWVDICPIFAFLVRQLNNLANKMLTRKNTRILENSRSIREICLVSNSDNFSTMNQKSSQVVLKLWKVCILMAMDQSNYVTKSYITRSCEITFLIYKIFFRKFRKHSKRQWSTYVKFFPVEIFFKNWKTYWQLQLNVNIFAKFSLKRSWQRFFSFCCIFQIFSKIFCKMK